MIFLVVYVYLFTLGCLDFQGGTVLFTKGAESAILPFATGGEIEKTRLHVDEFALVRNTLFRTMCNVTSIRCPAACSVTAILHMPSVGGG